MRRRPRAGLVALLRPVPLAWFVGVVGVGGWISSLPVPAAKLWATVWMLVAGGIPARRAVAADRRLHEQERLHSRAPRRADPALTPEPAARSARRDRVTERVALGIGVLMVAGILVATPFLARSPDGGVLGLPPAADWVILPLGALGLGADLVHEWRKARRRRTFDPSLPRGSVTVLGFTGPARSEVVVVPGEVVVPTDPATGEYAAVLAGPVPLWRLTDLRPGDVLVCDGHLRADAVVHLSDGSAGAWTTLRTVHDAELAAPTSWREELRAVAEDVRREEAERHEQRQDRIAGTLPPLDGDRGAG